MYLKFLKFLFNFKWLHFEILSESGRVYFNTILNQWVKDKQTDEKLYQRYWN